jgi:hypothetical protein
MKTIIYYLHKGDKIPFYVGKTKNLKNRLNTHKSVFGKNIFIEFLDEVEDWKYWEKHYISLFKNLGYILENKNNGGGGPSEGVIFPEERKQKISKIKKLSESISQEVGSIKFLNENPTSKLIGKTNKKNLVFEMKGNQYRVDTKGQVL